MNEVESALDYLITYAWMILIALIIGGAAFATLQDDNTVWDMPSDFNLSESREAVERAMPGNCENTWNDTAADQYIFECSQNLNNYTYIGEARVAYNSSGPDKVYVFQ